MTNHEKNETHAVELEAEDQTQINQDTESEAEESEFSLLRTLLPYLVTTVLVSFMCSVVFVKYVWSPSGAINPANFVTFDPVKYVAGQKAVASAFLTQDSDKKAQIANLLQSVSQNTRKYIEQVAQGRIVMVKQGVVGGVYTDITDDVMKKAGLPTQNLPTVDVMTQMIDVDPTILTASMIGTAKEIERKYAEQNKEKLISGLKDQGKQDSTVLP